MHQLSFDSLWQTPAEQSVLRVDLVRNGIITCAASKKLERSKPVSLKAGGQLCEGLGVGVESVIQFRAV